MGDTIDMGRAIDKELRSIVHHNQEPVAGSIAAARFAIS